METNRQGLVTIEELAKEVNISKNWLYQRTRKNALPGLRRVGKHLRVDYAEFSEALAQGDVK